MANLGRANNGLEFHHILPNSVFDNSDYIQDMAAAGFWSQNSNVYNGIYLPTDPSVVANTGITSHRTSHPAYNRWYTARLEEIADRYGTNYAGARNEIMGLNNYLKDQFVNPDSRIGLRLADMGTDADWDRVTLANIRQTDAFKLGNLGIPIRVAASTGDFDLMSNSDVYNTNSTMTIAERRAAYAAVSARNLQFLNSVRNLARTGTDIDLRTASDTLYAVQSGKVSVTNGQRLLSGAIKSIQFVGVGGVAYTLVTPSIASAAVGVIDGLDKGSMIVDVVSLSLLGYGLAQSDVIPEGASLSDIVGLLRSSNMAGALVGKLDDIALGVGKEVFFAGVATMLGFGLLWKGYEIYQSIDGLDGALAFAAEQGSNPTIDGLANMVSSVKQWFGPAGRDLTAEERAMRMGQSMVETLDNRSLAMMGGAIRQYLEAKGDPDAWRYLDSELPHMMSVLAYYAKEEGVPLSDLMKNAFALHLAEEDAQMLVAMIPDACFAAGTQITMWDGSKKAIELIEADDIVMSYDAKGAHVPGRVTQTFVNSVTVLLDLFGTKVTPGHVSLCGDGVFAGRHVPMIDILRSDGALVLTDGTKVRAATGAPLGTPADQMVVAVTGDLAADGTLTETSRGAIRAGTRVILSDGRDISVYDLILAAGATVTADGMIDTGAGPMPFHWHFASQLPNPEDYVLARSKAHLADIYAADEWEGVGPQLPAPMGAATKGSGPMMQ